MNAIAVLYTLCVVTLCRGTKCGESLDPLHVLDISNVDRSKVTVDEGTEDGISYKSYVPKANKDLKRVLDGEAILWKASSDKEKCTLADLYTGAEYRLAKLHIRDGVKSRFECFKKVDDGWQSIEEANFDGLLEGMRNGSKQEGDAEDDVECKANDSEGGLFLFPELPEDNAVEEDDYSTGDLHDEIVSPEEHNGGPHDVVLESIGSPTELPDEPILQSPTSPVRLTPQEVVSTPRTPIQAPLNDKGVALDISSPDSTKVSVTSRTSEGVKSTLFYPEGHVSIVCIMDSGMPILAEAGTICTETYLFSKPGFPPLLKVHTKAGGSNACTYFEKVDGGWKTIDKDDFDGKLGTMKNGMVRNVDVQNVESVPNTRTGTPLQARGPTPYVNTLYMEIASVAVAPRQASPQQTVDHHQDTMLMGQESKVHINYQDMVEASTQVIPTAPPMPEEYVQALLRGQEQDIHMHSQHMPQEPIPLPMQNVPSTQPIPQVQLIPSMMIQPQINFQNVPQVPTPSIGNSLMADTLTLITDAVPPMPTPPMDVPSTVEPRVTYNALRNEIESRVQEEPGEMMMARPVKTKKKKLREESVPIVKTVDLAKGDSLSTIVYEVVEDGITHKSYFPKNHIFDKILDGDELLWTAGSGEESTLVFTYSKLGHPKILSVYVNGKSAYFEKNGKEWTRITDKEFNAKHEAMKAKEDEEEILQEKDLSSKSTAEEPKEEYVETHVVTVKYPKLENLVEKHTPEVTKESVETPVDPTNLHHSVKTLDIDDNTGHATLHGLTQETPFSFDLASPDYSNVTVSKRERNGMEQTKYSPRDGYILTEITHDQEKVWHASGNERCTRALVNSNKDFALLCIDVDGSDIKKRRFRMVDGEWTVMSPKEIVGKILRTRRVSEQEPTECARQALEDHSTEVDSSAHSFEHDEGEHKFDGTSDTLSSSYDLESDFEDEEQNVVSKPYIILTDDIAIHLPKHTLDFSNPDPSKVHVHEGVEDGISYKNYTVKKNFAIRSISENGRILCTLSKDEGFLFLESYLKDNPTLIIIGINKGGKFYPRCFEKNAKGEWKNITEIDFFKKLKNVSQIPLTGKEGYTAKEILDLANLDNVDKRVRNVYGVDLTEYHPKNDCKIKIVVDSGQTLWATTGGGKCKFVQLYPQGNPPIISIGITNGRYFHPICFEKVAGQWKTISEGDYYGRLKGESSQGTTTTKEHSDEHTLDIAKMSPSRTDVETHIVNGIGLNYYSPKDGSVIKSVMDNGWVVWKASENESCGSLGMVSKDDFNLLMLGINTGNTLKLLYFEQNGQEWKEIEERDYNGRLETMKAPSTNQAASPDVQARISPRPSPGTFLDLTSPDINIFFVKEKTSRAYKCSEYEPKYSHRKKITSLMYGDLEVWKANADDGETLEDCTIYTKDGYSSVMCFNFGVDKAKYMLQHDGTWRDINERLFYDELKRMDKNAQEDGMTTGHGPQSMVSQEHTLDISSPDPFKIVADEQKINESIYRKLSAKLGVVINAVVDSGETLWTPSVCEVVGEVTLISSGTTNLLSIGFTKNGRFNCKYFEKVYGRWTLTDRNVFTRKLPEGTN